MRQRFGIPLAYAMAALTALAPLGGALAASEPGRGTITPQRQYQPARTIYKSITIPAGTRVPVRVASSYDSKTGNGRRWSGTVTRSIVAGGRRMIPAGSRVYGVVSAVPAKRGNRASVRLRATSVVVGGKTYPLRGVSGAMIASSPRTRNLGGIAAGTVGGAIVGRAVGGSGKGAVVGGLIGAGATTAAVAASKGYQAKLPAGTVMTVRMSKPTVMKVAVRRA